MVYVSSGLSLYFEDGHDDLDDCEYTEHFSNFTNQYISIIVTYKTSQEHVQVMHVCVCVYKCKCTVRKLTKKSYFK